jgi:hypothetical protein
MSHRAGLKCALLDHLGGLLVIAGLASRDDTASNGRLQLDNRDVLGQMRQADRDAWQSVRVRLGERDCELREQTGG